MNKFADLSRAEFKAIYLSGLLATKEDESVITLHDLTKAQAYPSGSVDWTTKGVVTGVKDQEQCGACWAFSATGAVEGLVAINHPGILTPLSEQQLIDCSGSFGNAGCNGGRMTNAFAYIHQNGLCSEQDYPYRAQNGFFCQLPSGTCSAVQPYTMIGSYQNLQRNEEALGHAVDSQPVSVAIEADQSGFQLYYSGVYNDPSCGKVLDHGVLAVGYGTDGASGLPYWKVKNSWGTNWGEKGYIRMVRNINECGIADETSIPTA